MNSSEWPMIVSVDDHVVEPPHLFERWLPRKFHDRAPRVERRRISRTADAYHYLEDPDGEIGDVWIFGQSAYVHRQMVVILKDVDTDTSPAWREKQPVTYEQIHPACYDPKARMELMTSQHVEASLGFPTFPRFCGQAFSEQTAADRDLGLACIRAYNDWMVEEWCGDSNGRLIPLPVVPLWDSALAAEEIRRNADRGVRAVAWSEIVGHLGFASIHEHNWDPFFEACQETGTVICMHIGSSSTASLVLPPGSPPIVVTCLQFANSYASIADFIFSGVLDDFPSLKLAYSEGQAGWLPYAIERMDHAHRSHTWARGERKIKELPSTYVRRNIFGCIFSDRHAIENAAEIGFDNLMFETDFPHADGVYPHTYDHIGKQFAGVDPDLAYRILRGNAIRVFELNLDRDLNGTSKEPEAGGIGVNR